MPDALGDGWAHHDTEAERVAAELEAAADAPIAAGELVPLLELGVHTLGEHLRDWPRARRLAERALEGRAPTPETAKAWAHLSIARLLAGDPVGAMEAELVFLGAAGGDFRPALIEARFMLVAALVGCGRAADASPIYAAALELARGLGEAAPHRIIALASNNLASELVEATSRSADETALMRLAADAAHEFWLQCGTWLHDERARYLQALVANALGDPDGALAQADAALAIIAANGEAPVDTAFLRLARAHALRLSGDAAAAVRELELADEVAATWDDAGLKDWYAETRARSAGA
jgi:tetratricopeptide (TPR) repeat protein